MRILQRPHLLPLGIGLALVAVASALACRSGERELSVSTPATLPAAAEHGLGLDAAANMPSSDHGAAQSDLGTVAHEQRVMKSAFCADCHPADFAEHAQNTHGRAFTDEEVRLATGRFSQADCIICHTPRPVGESGIGQNPIRRFYDLEEGNSCMTCHWKEGADYTRFVGGVECKTAFDPRVGTVESCASCHRNHGTPYQWELSPNGKAKGNVCMDCHMPTVVREVAVGGPVREVHSHVFPASRSITQLQKAYGYEAKLDGNEVVVTIANKGAGHNFPTELKQRSVESLVVVRDAKGQEVARSRMTFRDPYKRPYGLTLAVNTQIPSGESREHRVPITVADGTVECELHYKLYYPIEDYHPDLARRLESRRIPFNGVAPSTKSVESEPDVKIVTPEGISPEQAGPANLVDYAHPPIGKVEVEIPTGSTPADIDKLISLFQFPLTAANIAAREKLTAIGAPAVPQLVTAMGSWDNKTWNQAMTVLQAIGAPAQPAVIAGLTSDQLYIRLHAAELCSRMGLTGENGAVVKALIASLKRPNALDRQFAATALGDLHAAEAQSELRRLLLEDRDPDVVRSAARAMPQLGAKDAIPEMVKALGRFEWIETRRDISEALAKLGDPTGIAVLLDGLDYPDDLIRESCFEAFFAVTGKHFCYDPLAPHWERLASLSRLRQWWTKDGGPAALRKPMKIDYATRSEVRKICESFGGSDGSVPVGDATKQRQRLLDLGPAAVPGLSQIALKYPPGWSDKRAMTCEVLGVLRDPDAVPALIQVLRDPVVAVAAWGCDALGKIDDPDSLPAVQRYHQRLLSLASKNEVPQSAGSPDALISMAASTCYRLGDARMEPDLVGFLLSDDASARKYAYDSLRERYGDELDYDPDTSPEDRRAAVEAWQAKHEG